MTDQPKDSEAPETTETVNAQPKVPESIEATLKAIEESRDTLSPAEQELFVRIVNLCDAMATKQPNLNVAHYVTGILDGFLLGQEASKAEIYYDLDSINRVGQNIQATFEATLRALYAQSPEIFQGEQAGNETISVDDEDEDELITETLTSDKE